MRRTTLRCRSRRAQGGRAGATPAAEILESRVLLAVNPVSAVKQSENLSRINSRLLELHDSFVGGELHAQRAAAAEKGLQVDGQGRVSVTVKADNVNAITRRLERIGFVTTASFPDKHFSEGLLPVSALTTVRTIAGKSTRFGIQPNYAPVTLTGSVNSQADFVLEADRVRATLPAGFNGAGQKIGVLSDSYNKLGGAAADIASGDLPAAGVTVLSDFIDPSSTDEGRAMLQLIHDLAPGSPLAFATAFGGEGTFANNIRALANPASYGDGQGAKVIVDDVGYFAEPMFQDGVIAQAIDEVATTRGVNYFSAAGNQASRAYESTAFTTAADTLNFPGGGAISGQFYDFNTGAGIDTRQRITVPANSQVVLSFQWDDPFYTASGVDTDLDLYFINPTTGLVVSSANSNNLLFQDPVEVVGFSNNTANAVPLDLAIHRFAGPNPGRIKYVNFGSGGVSIDDFPTNSPTVIPHAAAANGQGVAAAPYFDQNVAEGFTSKGPATILFAPNGTPLGVPQVRNSPQITATDGTDTTFFGSDFEGNGRPNFFGTSAAAPHAAAVAALVRQANPSFTPAQVNQRLQSTATDIGAPGFDTLTGFGLINAFDAIYPTIVPATVNFSDGFETGVLSSAYETHSTRNGHTQITTANGPASGARHLTLDASVGFTSIFGLNEVTLHVNLAGAGTKTLAFRNKEFGDEDDIMPASFTNSSNSDGVALSVDGVTWFRVVSLTGTNSTATYTLRSFDLSAVAAANGIVLGADTRIRFQQYDNLPINSDGMAFDDISVTSVVPTPPVVAAVFANSSAGWGPTFRNFLTTSGQGETAFGFRVPADDQTRVLPWINLDQFSVRFSENVSVAADDLVVRGVNSAVYPTVAFAYDPATFTATWTLGGFVSFEKILLDLDAGAGTGVTDIAGAALDGEWTNPVAPATAGDTFPSGDGSPGGNFRFRVNILPGDTSRNGAILGNDVTLVRLAQGLGPGEGVYTIFKDVNGSGSILGNDVTFVRVRQGNGLPEGEPAAPTPAFASAAAQMAISPATPMTFANGTSLAGFTRAADQPLFLLRVADVLA